MTGPGGSGPVGVPGPGWGDWSQGCLVMGVPGPGGLVQGGQGGLVLGGGCGDPL